MTLFFLGLLSGIIIGAVAIWLAMARRNAELRTQLQKEFKLAAGEALSEANQQFLTAAIKDLRLVKTESEHEIEDKKQAISGFVSDMKSKMEDYQKTIKRFEDERISLYAKMEQSIAQVLSAEQAVRLETNSLKRVLTSSSGVRGKWGEKILEEILDQNNFIKGINYESQVSAGTDGGSDIRPDFVIHLPGKRKLIIDCKEVVSEYVMAQDSENPEEQKSHYEKLVSNIRTNFIKLSRKEYQSILDAEIPFVVMFIPSEAAIRAAFATDPGLFEEATSRKVILASPMTIIPLIFLIKQSWQQQQLAENARELGASVEVLGERLYKFIEHLHSMRQGLRKTVEGWDKAVSSWETRVAPQIEKAKNLGGRLKDSESLEKIETNSRLIEEEI